MTAAQKLQQEEKKKAKIMADFQNMEDCITELSPSEAELFKAYDKKSEMLELDDENANNLDS